MRYIDISCISGVFLVSLNNWLFYVGTIHTISLAYIGKKIKKIRIFLPGNLPMSARNSIFAADFELYLPALKLRLVRLLSRTL